MTDIYDLLYRLGATENYTGFFHMAYAVWLCVEQPDRLLLVTKWLYPEVAKQYRTNWKAVERNIRTELHHLAGKSAFAGRTGAQTSGAETPKRPDAGHSGLVTGYRASGGSWTG